MFVFPVPTGARPSGPASGGVSDGEPAACLITVGGLPVAGQIDGCTSLSDIRRPPDHWTAGEIFPASAAQGSSSRPAYRRAFAMAASSVQ